MGSRNVVLLEESECMELAAFLAERIYEFNAKAIGCFDGKLLAGTVTDGEGIVIGAFNGHTWGGCCQLDHLWVEEAHRRLGIGGALVRAAEDEARRRGCRQVVLSTHDFQSPEFYERLGYVRLFVIPGQPQGHANIFYVKHLHDGGRP